MCRDYDYYALWASRHCVAAPARNLNASPPGLLCLSSTPVYATSDSINSQLLPLASTHPFRFLPMSYFSVHAVGKEMKREVPHVSDRSHDLALLTCSPLPFWGAAELASILVFFFLSLPFFLFLHTPTPILFLSSTSINYFFPRQQNMFVLPAMAFRACPGRSLGAIRVALVAALTGSHKCVCACTTRARACIHDGTMAKFVRVNAGRAVGRPRGPRRHIAPPPRPPRGRRPGPPTPPPRGRPPPA